MILLMNYLPYSHVGSSGPKSLDSIYKLYILTDLNLLTFLAPQTFPCILFLSRTTLSVSPSLICFASNSS